MRLLALAAASLLLLTACQLRLGADVTVGQDGSGSIAVRVALDQELVGLLDEAGVDPLEGLEEAQQLAPDWQVEVREGEGVEVTLTAPFDDPAGFERLAGDLHAALDPADGALYRDLRLRVDGDGSAAFSGRLGLLLPAAPGAEGAGVQFDRDDLQRLLDERGDEFVRYELRLTLPAEPSQHDADEVSGRSLVWRAPVGSLRDVSATSPAPAATSLPVAAAVVVVSAAAAAAGVVLVRRRGARRGGATGAG